MFETSAVLALQPGWKWWPNRSQAEGTDLLLRCNNFALLVMAYELL
ncbi:hypothetical protein [Adhaeretor mobilis]|uniref:Uncharacterized protein n=1 Tax=Adhaeretor mobilis TaxID=1930276 RepID=A0A517N325_9BACT|nr:hypothetical protein [Adhaeretor mobilis]QDT01536.1 hypothetical protein HG15A2_48780 [Adhaeretor mobilis]